MNPLLKYILCLGLLLQTFVVQPSHALDNLVKNIEAQRQSYSASSSITTTSSDSVSSMEKSTASSASEQEELDYIALEDQAKESKKQPLPKFPECWENLAFYCGKSVCCYYSIDLDNDRRSNHECHPNSRNACRCVTGIAAVISTVLLAAGAGTYDNGDCMKCIFAEYFKYGSRRGCDPCCRVPFMSVWGVIDAVALCPVLPIYSAYCCAQCMNKKQFTKKFLEGQSCLPEHRVSLRNCFSSFVSLFNPCCGPTD